MKPPITTYAGLLAAVEALGPPPTGMVRVYRGQNQDYPEITPSGVRHVLRRRAIWHAYTRHLRADLIREGSDLTDEMLQAMGVWLHVISQHYGPGSDFLDVTYSLEMALWFALGELIQNVSHGSIGPPGPPNPATDHPTEVDVWTFRPWNKAAYIYVFDLPKWNGKDLAEAGSVVDLADAPDLFSSSRRIQAQSACLIYCRNKDLSTLNVRLLLKETFSVVPPIQDAPGLARPVAEIFPSPEQDPWYARLLSVPMTYAPTPSPPKLQRSIPVAVYADETNPDYTRDVRWRDVALPLPLLHRAFENFQRPASGSEQKVVPIPIILEAPLVFANPPGDSEAWNHALVATSVPDRCPIYDFGNAVPSGEVSLTDVLFEFSFLEYTGWDRIVKEQISIRLLRGVWLRQQGDTFGVALVYQDVPGSEPEVVGFLPLRLDVTLGRLVWFDPQGKQPSVPITNDPETAKPVLLALMLLRELSSNLKVEPIPRVEMGITANGGDVEREFLLVINRESARLYRVAAPPPWGDWFVLRAASNPEEPFTQATTVVDTFKLRSTKPFRDVPIEAISKNLKEQSR